jgi:glycosyltransferase involved in cell wall biosynthesis
VSRVLARADLVLALSEAWRVTLHEISPQARLEVLMNAVPLPPLEPAQRRESPQPTLLFLGEIARHKGVLELAHSFAQVTRQFPQLELVYGGTGSALQEVRDLTMELELGDRVRFTGWLEAERKRAAFAGATIFVLPSYVEGMPMALLEAMSWGLPTIATAVGGVPEIITHEANGLLIPPGDTTALAAAIARLMSDAPLRRRLGAAARATVAERFSLDTAIRRLLEFYRRFGIEPRGVHARRDTCLDATASDK